MRDGGARREGVLGFSAEKKGAKVGLDGRIKLVLRIKGVEHRWRKSSKLRGKTPRADQEDSGGMWMDVSILPLQKIFALDVQFRVPLYQRPYVWDRDRQWVPLWEDVVSLADRYLADSSDISHHFLGAVVVRQQLKPVGTLETRDVIDGQQRLTTLQLLADAVEEVIHELEGSPLERRKLQKLVLNDTKIFDGDDRFKIWPTNADRDVFRHAMTDESSVPEDLVDKAIAKAHAFFKSQARDWVQESDPSNGIDKRFAALVTAISHGVHLVVINLDDDDNAQAIFETLNARGTALLASDLVKNYMLHEAEARQLDVEQFHRDHWRHLESDWWREEITLGASSLATARCLPLLLALDEPRERGQHPAPLRRVPQVRVRRTASRRRRGCQPFEVLRCLQTLGGRQIRRAAASGLLLPLGRVAVACDDTAAPLAVQRCRRDRRPRPDARIGVA